MNSAVVDLCVDAAFQKRLAAALAVSGARNEKTEGSGRQQTTASTADTAMSKAEKKAKRYGQGHSSGKGQDVADKSRWWALWRESGRCKQSLGGSRHGGAATWRGASTCPV